MVWHDFAYRALSGDAQLAEAVESSNYSAGAWLDGELVGCLCIGPADRPLLALSPADADCSRGMAARRLDDYIGETEPVVCACFQVASDSVRSAIAGGARNVAEIGERLRAGTNCGSCVPELKRIIVHERFAHPD
jgi:assimilatory nitrate reductase catalytic subunit